MAIFVTSNQQFGRPSAISKFKRPFKDVDEMNQILINEWNSVVAEKDIVYVLGNFAWDPETAERVINQLNGIIYLIEGENDAATVEIISSGVVQGKAVHNKGDIDAYDEAGLCFSYWPLKEWPKKEKGYYSLIGYPSKKYKTDHKQGIINVSCDNWAFKPISIKKIKSLFDELNQEQQ